MGAYKSEGIEYIFQDPSVNVKRSFSSRCERKSEQTLTTTLSLAKPHS